MIVDKARVVEDDRGLRVYGPTRRIPGADVVSAVDMLRIHRESADYMYGD